MTPASLSSLIARSIAALQASGGLPEGALTSEVVVERPKNREHGDWATNVAMQHSAKLGLKPREFAEILAPELQKVLKEVRTRVLDLSERNTHSLIQIEKLAVDILTGRGWQPDYIAIRQQSDLAPASNESLQADEPLVILTAAKLGKTRLIDNLEI